jgi:hypothetical protein
VSGVLGTGVSALGWSALYSVSLAGLWACLAGLGALPLPAQLCVPHPFPGTYLIPAPTLPSLRRPAVLLARRNDCGSKMEEFLARCFYQPVS